MEIEFQRQLRIAASFACACLNYISGGSIYLFSLYAPQLGKELGYNQVQLSLVGSTGDNGLYLMGPLTGPRWSCLLAAFGIFFGYTLMGFTFNHTLPNSSFILMAIYYGLVGSGLSFSCMSALNIVAKNSENHRGTALGIPSAFFGLSAFLLSEYSKIFLADNEGNLNVYKLLLSLGIAFGIINLMAVMWLRIVPSRVEEEVIVDTNRNEQTPLLTPTNTAITTYNNPSSNTNAYSFIDDPSAWLMWFSFLYYYKFYHKTSRLLFWIIAATIFLCSQLYAAFGLALFGSPEKALGTLWIVSISTGFSYGAFFSLGPTIASELWGLLRFGINWGIMVLAPAVGGFLMNLIFGILYDYRAKKQSTGGDFDPATVDTTMPSEVSGFETIRGLGCGGPQKHDLTKRESNQGWMLKDSCLCNSPKQTNRIIEDS
ncbi:6723_t:CDS:2 [Ambispora gerdemannii]|uniref:6723_t:CDS:1 n=1 Tax=Ambispora gerdemannii TaxID=144530 RepID=A0A9N8YJZ6_9GLOM|nr:6723_t:CDS:2 [Ambispora gerdemannii]